MSWYARSGAGTQNGKCNKAWGRGSRILPRHHERRQGAAPVVWSVVVGGAGG